MIADDPGLNRLLSLEERRYFLRELRAARGMQKGFPQLVHPRYCPELNSTEACETPTGPPRRQVLERHGGLEKYARGLEIFDPDLQRASWTVAISKPGLSA